MSIAPYIAVIDTETNWYDQVMSIGIAVADRETLEPVQVRYYVLTPEDLVGGMYDDRMALTDDSPAFRGTREQVLGHICRWLDGLGVREMFAYNAWFDCTHLPELSGLIWYDIMRIAAYRQYNPYIPNWADCCKTGRLKRSYGVEPMLRMLTGDSSYHETHNALYDAVDELQIMRCLGLRVEAYAPARL